MTEQATEGPPPQSSPRRRRRWPWVVGIAAAVIVLLFIVATAIIVALAVGRGGGFTSPGGFQEEYVSGSGTDRVAVIPVDGTILSDNSSPEDTLPTTTPRGLQAALDQAESDASVGAVVLRVNSPGGGVTPSAEMHRSLLEFREDSEKPVVVSMADTAASGGYYISTAADAIVAEETTLTGSLGVYLGLLEISEAADDLGVEQNYIRSGEFKTMGDPFRELTPEEEEIFQSIVDEDYQEFVNVISEGRDLPEDRVREIADGRVYSGLQALDLDLVDELGGLDRAVEVAAGQADLADDPTVVRYVQEPGLGSLLFARFLPDPPQAAQVLEASGIQFNGTPQYLYVPGATGSGNAVSSAR
ncbi:signal peptide peptidase SppA, 36K type [Rubrobacter radiotolerans]|uniref:Signal peptide peptidase SppA n=1 Tax=Rubrobacter radiotolerans TaxID=42256 RepID=A0A023X5W4_RUBRA|nr:signal peptide peptidase SppA [Rubrobacter radiotolerans]AHY47454.1 signal peptide peptidase SppA, 36K type [Rubrobacter radiotolerans]MDX5894857.1 signal peptide peptidase SppA [Rubrobacter radiotolerans]SMC06934.1 protease-4 [Rubrobacter radiotolerans DSM 5868]